MPRLNDHDATLEGEAGLVRAYLELMHMRIPDRLQFRVDIPDELKTLRFPSMALLTLVENAVRHGIDPSEQGGTIEVTALRAADGAVHVAVVDSGVGMSETAAAGTGLANLRERLAGFYAGAASLDLIEHPPHGLRACIVIRSEGGP